MSSDGRISRWLQRPFYPHRKVGVGPKLTNFGALVVFVVLGAVLAIVGVMAVVQ